MDIKETAVAIHKNNIDKGFINPRERRNVGEVLMLVTSELGEALEADRAKKHFNDNPYKEYIKDQLENTGIQVQSVGFQKYFQDTVKNTFEDEVADAVIRLFDISEEFGFDLEWHIKMKMRYNATRPYKHNKQY